MSARKTTGFPRGMVQARRRLDRWRKTRTAGLPIPKSLWAVAVKLARRHGVCPTSRALGLEYNKLKGLSQFVEHTQKASPSAAFVELITPQPAGVSPYRIELEGPRGGRMKIELPIASADLLLGFCRVVWGARAT